MVYEQFVGVQKQEHDIDLFFDSIKSKETRIKYSSYLKKYLEITGIDNLLSEKDPRLIERQIIDFIIKLKKEGKNWGGIHNYVSMILAFYKINDVVLNTTKITKFMPEQRKVKKDRGYTHEEISKMLEFADERTRVIILLLASTGMRIGALPSLRIGNVDNNKITVYEKFYMYMTKDTFTAMTRATPDKFQFSIKVPETVTHDKRLDVSKGAMALLDEFLEKISPLKSANKLGAVLIQLPPSFTVKEFRNTEQFLDRLPSGYDYALEFRNPSWNTEGPWELLKHYNIAAVMTDSPEPDRLQFLSEPIITAKHSFIRWHGRQVKPRYNYLYSKEELKPWAEKVKRISTETAVVRGYFNNHYGAKAVVNALEFKEMLGTALPEKERAVLENAQNYFPESSRQLTLDKV